MKKIPTILPSKISELIIIDTTNVSAIPDGLPSTIKALLIQNSNITMTPKDYMRIPSSLEELWLKDNNNVKEFDLSRLNHVPNLNSLFLENGPIHSLKIPSASPIQLEKIYLGGLNWKILDATKYEQLSKGAPDGGVWIPYPARKLSHIPHPAVAFWSYPASRKTFV